VVQLGLTDHIPQIDVVYDAGAAQHFTLALLDIKVDECLGDIKDILRNSTELIASFRLIYDDVPSLLPLERRKILNRKELHSVDGPDIKDFVVYQVLLHLMEET